MLANASAAQSTRIENAVEGRLAREEQVAGGTVTSPPSGVFRAMTNSCFDLLWIEMQHGALTYRDVERMIFACKGVPAIPCTRVPEATAGDNQKTTDTGALGIIVPLIDSAAKIEAAVKFRGTRPKAFAVSAEAGTGRFGATTTGRRPTTTS